LGCNAAERFWDGLRRGVAAIKNVSTADLETAWAIGEMFSDQDFSIVDRTSFTVMHASASDGWQRLTTTSLSSATRRDVGTPSTSSGNGHTRMRAGGSLRTRRSAGNSSG
jgi:hypothetical protein